MGTPKKVFIEHFDMPKDIETAVFELCKAVRRNGYNVGCATAINGEVDNVSLFRWFDDGSEEFLLEYGIDGEWNRYAWGEQ